MIQTKTAVRSFKILPKSMIEEMHSGHSLISFLLNRTFLQLVRYSGLSSFGLSFYGLADTSLEFRMLVPTGMHQHNGQSANP